MERVKGINGYTIMRATARDVKKYNVTEGTFYIYFSSDLRDYGLANSDPDWECDSLVTALEWCVSSNYATAKEIAESRTTAASFEEIAEIEKQLDAGMSPDEIEQEYEENDEEENEMRKHYINSRTGEDTASATLAMKWHRAGDMVQVNTFYNEPHKTGLANVVHIPGAPQNKRNADDENREHCRRIAQDVEDYAEGRVYRCPDCNEIITLPDDVGDKYRCPDCGTVYEIDEMEPQSLYDYFEDCLDIEFRVSGRSRDALRSVQIMVACGGPNIYIDTATKQVELYWWTDRANYPISYSACDEIDDWAAEFWGCM